MSDSESLLIDATTRIFRDLCDPQTVNAREDNHWKTDLWTALEDSGLTLAWVSEDRGGSGAAIVDGFDILSVSGRFAAPVPLGETLLAGWLLSAAGLDVPTNVMTVAPARSRDRIILDDDGVLAGRASGVPFAASAALIVAVAERDGQPCVVQVTSGDCAVQTAPGLSGDGRDHVIFDGVRPTAIGALPDGFDADSAMLMGAAIRAIQIGGALQAILDIATAYSKERVAFERPIARFQAVQHNLAELAGEAAAAVAAASSAADAIGNAVRLDEPVFFEIAAAKIRAGEAAGRGAAIAHQVHGAIGFTADHILHRYTQRLWSWRDDFGSESEWAVRLGEFVARNGADELWPLLASR